MEDHIGEGVVKVGENIQRPGTTPGEYQHDEVGGHCTRPRYYQYYTRVHQHLYPKQEQQEDILQTSKGRMRRGDIRKTNATHVLVIDMFPTAKSQTV